MDFSVHLGPDPVLLGSERLSSRFLSLLLGPLKQVPHSWAPGGHMVGLGSSILGELNADATLEGRSVSAEDGPVPSPCGRQNAGQGGRH